MRWIFAAALFAVPGMLPAAPVDAQVAKSYPWCAMTSGYGKECVYDNIAQCQQDVQGNGGTCSPGPNFDPAHPQGSGEFPQPPNQ